MYELKHITDFLLILFLICFTFLSIVSVDCSVYSLIDFVYYLQV